MRPHSRTRSRRLLALTLVSALLIGGCGRPKTFDASAVQIVHRIAYSGPRSALIEPGVVADDLISFGRWLAGVRWQAAIAYAEAVPRPVMQSEAVAAAVVLPMSGDGFLACTRAHESDSAGGYAAVSSSGTYRGAYQFDQSTWDSAAQLAGRADLVGADPATVEPGAQDQIALALYGARGNQPWGGRC